MFTTNIRRITLTLTLGFGALALAASGAPAMADNVVSHTQSTAVAPSLLPATSTTPKAVAQKQIKRSTIVNPDGTVETQAEASRTTYDAQGNLVTTTKTRTESSDGAVIPATPPAKLVRHGNTLTIDRGGNTADDLGTESRSYRSGYGATRTGGNFNE